MAAARNTCSSSEAGQPHRKELEGYSFIPLCRLQFEAISIALWGTAVYAPLLRQAAVSYMRANPEEYVGFLGDSFDAYLRSVGAGGGVRLR